MTNVSETVSAGQLRAFIERIERLESEKRTIADDIKEVKAEAKACGFDVGAINALVKLRKIDAASRQEQEAILDIYKAALGMLPLEEYAARDDAGPSYAEATGRESTTPKASNSKASSAENGFQATTTPQPVQEMHKLPEGEATANQFQAKASEDNGATGTADDEVPSDSMTGEVSRVDAGRTASATSDYGRDSVERHAPNSPSATLPPPGDADKAEAVSSSPVSAPISDEGIPAFLKRERKPLRPNCLHPELCASGFPREHCHTCKVAMAESEVA